MNISFVYAKGRKERYAKTVQGHAATEFFYGALELERRGHIITQYELDSVELTKLWHKLAEILYRWRVLPTRTNGGILAKLYELCPYLNKRDVIVATTTAAAFGLATLKLFGLVQRPIVAIHCGIVNFQLVRRRRKINAIALRNMWTQLFGVGELSAVQTIYHVPSDRIEVNQFGVDAEFWKPYATVGEYVLSVGSDERRDYDLLLSAAREFGEKFIILTRRKMKKDIPENVKILKGGWHEEAITDEALRTLYQKARVVVIPLLNSPQPSGQSVCLQAMACGKPVILTCTEGIWSSSMMRDGANVKLIPPGDLHALISAIGDIWDDRETRENIGREARKTVCLEANIKDFAIRMEALCKRAVKAQSK